MELRIAIVEDQKFEAQRLERLLRQAWGDPVVCDLYESGDAFLHRAAAGPYAVVFLDICMEGTNGVVIVVPEPVHQRTVPQTADSGQRIAVARDRKSTRLNSSHIEESRMPSSA